MSNCLQEVITHADFFAALSTDHSPVTISISKNKNSTVLCCQAKIKLQNHKNLIQTFHSNQNFILNAQVKRELLKYEIRKFTINYSKKETDRKKTLLENKAK